jgi:hypothetical protein
MPMTGVLLAVAGLVSSSAGRSLFAVMPDHEVVFEVRTAAGKPGGGSGEQITILFSNSSADTPSPPRPILGTDILQEFSFSGQDLVGNEPFRFTRRVRDVSFLEAKYIRVVNLSSDAWAGDYLSMSVNGRRILDRQSLYPRRGARKDGGKEGGIEKFNRAQWFERSFWQEELQRIRRDRYQSK